MACSRSQPPKIQFAPSPSGAFHIGSLRTYLANYLWARRNRWMLALKIDGSATALTRFPYIRSLLECLAWLKLEPDETSFSPLLMREFFQARPLSRLLRKVMATAAQCYLCSCALEAESEERARAISYDYAEDPCAVEPLAMDPNCAILAAGPDSAAVSGPRYILRLPLSSKEPLRTVAGGVLCQQFANPVIGVIAGNRFYAVGALAMYLMDLMNGITCAIRGVDIASIVAATQTVGGRIGAGLPETLLVAIVGDSDGAKLSKSAGAEGVLVLRDKAIFPERVLNNVFRSLNPHAGHGRGLSLGQMIDQFDLRQAPEYDVRVGADGLINLRAVRAREK